MNFHIPREKQNSKPLRMILELPQKDSDISNLFYTTLSLRSAIREVKEVDIKSGISNADLDKLKKIVPEQLSFSFSADVWKTLNHLNSIMICKEKSPLLLRTYYFLPPALAAKPLNILVWLYQ